MKHLIFVIVLASSTWGCSATLQKNLDNAAKLATGPCGLAVAGAIASCNQAMPAPVK